MVKSPYQKQIQQGLIPKDLSTRLLQFQQIKAIADALELLNDSKQNIQDLQDFAVRVKEIYNNYMDGVLERREKEIAENSFNTYEMEDIVDTQTDETKSVEVRLNTVRQFASHHMSRLVLSEKLGKKLSAGETEVVIQSLQGTLFAILDAQKNKNIDAYDLSERILQGKLHIDETGKILPILKTASANMLEQIKIDWQTYEDTQQQIPSLEKYRDDFEDLISDDKKFAYMIHPELNCAQMLIRDDFNKKDGSKQHFLQMIGCLMKCGSMKAKHGTFSQTSYQQIKDIFGKIYAQNADEALDNFLGVPPSTEASNKEEARQKAFAAKGKELYHKFLGAALVKRYEAEPSFSVDEFMHVMSNYIDDLQKGENSFEKLRLVKENDLRSVQETKDETADQQVVSVHHDVPVASAFKVCYDNHIQLHNPEKLNAFFNALKTECPEVLNNPFYQKYSRNSEDFALIGLGTTLFPDFGREAEKHNRAFLEKHNKNPQAAKQALENRHKITMVYKRFFPLTDVERAAMRNEILEMINDPSNHTLIVGRYTHISMEPEGLLRFIKRSDTLNIVANSGRQVGSNLAFAADYEEKLFAKVLCKFPDNSEIRKNLQHYNKANGATVKSFMNFNMPETKFIKSIRKFLDREKQTPIHYLHSIFDGISKQ